MNRKEHRVINARAIGWYEAFSDKQARRLHKKLRNKRVRAEQKKEVDNGRLSETEP